MSPRRDDDPALTPPRGRRRECHRCGRPIQKAQRVFMGIVFCSTCYAREFSRRPCRRCGKPARLHKSQETGLCRSCERAERSCLRCERPVPKAALLIEGKAVCPSCRRYFPPFHRPKRPAGHETCSVCRKHRSVEARDENGRPLCKLCAASDRREEVREIDERYWRENLLRRHAALEQRLKTPWCRKLLDGFVAHQVAKVPAMRLSLALERHVRNFRKLESRFASLDEIDSAALLERFNTEEMRRAQSLLEYLRDVGMEVPTRDQAEGLAEERRMTDLLESMRDSPHARILEGFHAHLAEPNFRGQLSKPKSRRLSLKAACGLIRTAGEKALGQDVLEAYLRAVPGQHAGVSRFVGYLSRRKGLAISLPPPRAPKVRQPSAREGDEALARCLRHLADDVDFVNLRAAVAGALVGLVALPLADVVRLGRGVVSRGTDGTLVIALPDDAQFEADPRITPGLARYLRCRDELTGTTDGFLFPGRPTSQHVNEGTISSRLKSWGAPVQVLAICARRWIKERARD